MKILHVLDHSLPLHSGYTFRTAAILREQRARGWETLHLTTPRHGRTMADVEQADGWEFFRTPPRPSARRLLPVVGSYLDEMAATRDRLRQLVRMHRPDVIHAHSPVLDVLPALTVGRSEGVPVVYEIRAFWEDAAVDHGTTTEGSVRYRATRALETYAVRNAQGIAVICEGLRRDVEERGIPRERITVIPNAVDADQFAFNAAPDAALRRELGLEGKLVLGFLGSFYAYEGLDVLLEALRQLLRENRERTIAARRGWSGGGCPEGARRRPRRGGRRAVHAAASRIPRSPRYYSLVDVLVYPRHPMRLTDLVTPLKPLEAMALGRIVVASDVGGHRELIADGQTGFLFRAGDPMALSARLREVLALRDTWDALRLRARHFVEEQRSWKQSVAGYEALYDRVCGRRPPSASVAAFENTAEAVR